VLGRRLAGGAAAPVVLTGHEADREGGDDPCGQGGDGQAVARRARRVHSGQGRRGRGSGQQCDHCHEHDSTHAASQIIDGGGRSSIRA
jgi:hypothetical protein